MTAEGSYPRIDQTGGPGEVIKSFPRGWQRGRFGYSPAGQGARAAFLYITAFVANVLICRDPGL
jgi:hypothetical protein